jgi:hypothetical protein
VEDDGALLRADTPVRQLLLHHQEARYLPPPRLFLVCAPAHLLSCTALCPLAAEEEPGLQDSSFLFFHDLSAMDPYYIMPILTSLTMLATIEVHNHTPHS